MRRILLKVSRNLKTLFIVLSLCSIAAMVFRADTLSWDRAALALAIAWVGLVPGLCFIATPFKNRPPFPLMSMVGLFYIVFFGLSAFFAAYLRNNDSGMINFFGISFLDEISIRAQVLVLIGMTLMFLFWAVSKRVIFSRIPRFSLPNHYSSWRLQTLIWGLVIGNLLYIHFPIVRSLPSIGQILQPAGYVGFALVLALLYQHSLNRWQSLAYFTIIFPLWVLGLLEAGSLTPLMLIGGLWIAEHLYFRARMPWMWMLTLAVFLAISYPIMSGYRSLTNQMKEDRAGISDHRILPNQLGPQRSAEKLKLISDAFSNLVELDKKALYERSVGIVRRTGLIFAFSKVVEETPEKIPYWDGETYKPMVTSWIPRMLWKNKPQEKSGYAFGYRYSLIGLADKHMSYNLPWVTELYVNFGPAGVILGMSLIGLFLGLLECIFNRIGQNVVEYGIGAAILIPLSFQESNFTLMTGSLLPLAVCLWLYFTIGLRFAAKKDNTHLYSGRA